ncbi:hypothetical protein VN97_g1723 [Penicillium thymicola]|uniref:Uncharacterized protein n=1 Tax=Penicillium thymicola TaxID=293382 RepID=A0AAI9TR32_PENTH|nr:hypothetical protein VN97_g1723 [Penicillium thymicola]
MPGDEIRWLRTAAQEAVNHVDRYCREVKDNIGLQLSGQCDEVSSWEERLYEEENTMKRGSEEAYESLRLARLRYNELFPEFMLDSGNQAFDKAIEVINKFSMDTLKWLRDSQENVDKWTENAEDKHADWCENVNDWY